MTDLERYEATREHALRGELSTVQWAAEADAAYQIAQRIVVTSFVPAQFRDKPAEAAAAIIAGAEVGLSPLAAMRSFDIIQGVAAPRALTLRAIAQRHGCRIQTVSETDRKVVMRGQRPDAASDDWETVEWTIERAQQLGVTGKDNWKKQPRNMLIARATAELVRRIAADAILGIPVASEELDGADAPGPKTVKRATAPKPTPALPSLPGDDDIEDGIVVERAPAPALDDPPMPSLKCSHCGLAHDLGPCPGDQPTEDTELPPFTDEPVTDAQIKKLHTVFNACQINDRADRLAYAADLAGREIESSKQLTRAEASALIDSLTAIEQARNNTGPDPAEHPPEDPWGQPPLPGED